MADRRRRFLCMLYHRIGRIERRIRKNLCVVPLDFAKHYTLLRYSDHLANRAATSEDRTGSYDGTSATARMQPRCAPHGDTPMLPMVLMSSTMIVLVSERTKLQGNRNHFHVASRDAVHRHMDSGSISIAPRPCGSLALAKREQEARKEEMRRMRRAQGGLEAGEEANWCGDTQLCMQLGSVRICFTNGVAMPARGLIWRGLMDEHD